MIRIAIAGYGNVGRGAAAAVRKNSDMELVCIFTHRADAVRQQENSVPAVPLEEAPAWKDRVDAVIICSGSATELPILTPVLAANFNVIDSYDNHSRIPEHFAEVDRACRKAGTCGIISVGWDPGLFSLARLYGQAVLPEGSSYTFWGRGVSQGHSDAIRHIPGVKRAIQYTVPVEAAVESVRRGERPLLTTRQKHTRECFVVPETGADREQIREAIVTMPAYFADYDTTVTFLSEEDFERDHGSMPHGGTVIRSGVTGTGNEQLAELRLTLASNPEFTGSVMAAYARAAVRLQAEGRTGAATVYDIAPALLLQEDGAFMRKNML